MSQTAFGKLVAVISKICKNKTSKQTNKQGVSNEKHDVIHAPLISVLHCLCLRPSWSVVNCGVVLNMWRTYHKRNLCGRPLKAPSDTPLKASWSGEASSSNSQFTEVLSVWDKKQWNVTIHYDHGVVRMQLAAASSQRRCPQLAIHVCIKSWLMKQEASPLLCSLATNAVIKKMCQHTAAGPPPPPPLHPLHPPH